MSIPTVVVKKKPSDVLKELGWTKKEYQCADGRCCLVGAIQMGCLGCAGYVVAHDSGDWDSYYIFSKAVFATISRKWPNMFTIAIWNDLPERTQEEVMEVLLTVEEQFGENLVVQA